MPALTYAFTLPAGAAKRLEAITQGVPLLTQAALMTAVAICQQRYYGRETQLVLAPARDAEPEQTPRWTVLIDRLTPDMTFRDALLHTREALLDARDPDDQAVREARHALAGPGTALEPAVMLMPEHAGAVAPRVEAGADGHPDVVLAFTAEPGEIRGVATCTAERDRASRIARLCRHLAIVLETGLNETSIRLRDIPLVEGAERATLLNDYAAGPAMAPVRAAVHESIAHHARLSPASVALESASGVVTYGTLDERANRLARRLARHLSQPEDRVAVLVDRRVELGVAFFAVMKAGGVYVPLDPDWPAERLAYMLGHSAARCVLTCRALRARVPPAAAAVIEIDIENDDAATVDAAAAAEASSPIAASDRDALAYVIYTSGSTGLPKGVGVSHAALATRIGGLVQQYGITSEDRVLQCLSPSTDAFGEELYPALTCGATLVIHPDPTRLSAAETVALLDSARITIAHMPAAHWIALATALHAAGTRLPPSVRLTIVGGEALPADRVARWISDTARGTTFVNAYGPTEAVITATTWTCRDAERLEPLARVPIGAPLPATRVYVLDESLEPAPIGVAGDLHIGGAALARGYVDDPEATASRFMPDPFAAEPSARMYRTGDRGRWREEGEIEFLGRLDEQIKIRGSRIEPAEIEAVLDRHPAILQSAVVKRQIAGQDELVAFLVPRASGGEARGEHACQPDQTCQSDHTCTAPVALTYESVRAHLERALPAAIVPSSCFVLDALSLTPSGKIDRLALSGGAPLVPESANVHPRDSIETHIQQLWRDVLQLDRIGIRDNFFASGGHSLRAVALAARMEQAYGAEVPVRMIFDHPTIEQQAAFIRREVSIALPLSVVPVRAGGSLRPLFCVHPAGGLVQVYADLARHLDPERPLYSLQSYGLGRGEAPVRRIEEMAARYLGDLRAVQSEGPYQLTGLSMGCLVAYEMACQLAARGEAVSLLALLDGGPVDVPDVFTDDDWSRELRAWIDEYPIRRGIIELGVTDGDLRPLPPRERLQRYLEAAQRLDIVPRDVGLEQFERFLNVYGSNVLAGRQYAPGPYDGPVTLIRTAVRPGVHESLGWAAVAPQLTIHEMPGEHAAFVREPHVRMLGDMLEREMRRAPEPAHI